MKIKKSALLLLFIIPLYFISCDKPVSKETIGITDERAVVNISNPDSLQTSFCNISFKWEYYRNVFLNASLFYNDEAEIGRASCRERV